MAKKVKVKLPQKIKLDFSSKNQIVHMFVQETPLEQKHMYSQEKPLKQNHLCSRNAS